MGLNIEAYTLAELNKLTSPSSVIPALFWVIPLGSWESNDLKKIWDIFTENNYPNKFHGRSHCKSLGLLLVKDNFMRDTPCEANLSDLTGKLEELLPEGINSIYNENEFKNDNLKSNKFLVLSGCYPQPGWGLFVTANNYENFINDLEDFLENHFGEIMNLFKEAQLNYFNWSNYSTKIPIRENTIVLDKIIETIEKIIPLLNLLQEEIKNKTYNLFHFEVLNKLFIESNYQDINNFFIPFNNIFNEKFIFSILILKLINNNGISKDEVNNLIHSFLYEFDKNKNNLFKTETIKTSSTKRVIGSFILKNKDKLSINEDPVSFYENYYLSNITSISESYNKFIEEFSSYYGKIKYLIVNSNKQFEDNLKIWIAEKEYHRINFQEALASVLEFQSKNSYRFLFNLENHLLEKSKAKYLVKSITWDPPRMVGWKLLATGIEIENFDVTEYIKEKIPEFCEHINNMTSNESIDGNSFTDYIHYYSINKSNLNPRLACKEILSKILRPSEIRNILNKLRGNYNPDEGIESILTNFGWPLIEQKNIPLSNCIEINKGKPTLISMYSGNQIRIILENFCKDLIDVLISKLGFDIEQIYSFIKYETENKLMYDNLKRNRSWDNFLNQLQLKQAFELISLLLKKVFPSNNHKLLLENLEKIRIETNHTSHDNPNAKINQSQLAEAIFTVLNQTHDLISEMPWHFNPLQKNGILPVVFTGLAWSHSYPNEKQISIILWNANNSTKEMLIWNPDKKNPVMPNAKRILRPD